MLGVSELVIAAVLGGLINLMAVLYQNFRLGRVMSHALEIVAQRISPSPASENGKA